MSTLTARDFFFCYNEGLFDYLQEKGFRYICVGLNTNSHRKFFQYHRTEALDQAINNYKQQPMVEKRQCFTLTES
jgi:hypothetical protein